MLVLHGRDVRHLRREGGLLTRRVRFRTPNGEVHEGVVDESAEPACVAERHNGLRVPLTDAATLALPEPYELLRPLDPPEVWCAGVTYERSRDARVGRRR